MSVIIKGLAMPTSCAECEIEAHYENSYGDEYGHFCPIGYKAYTSEIRYKKRRDDCPLVPVTDHGDLIDGDKLYKDITESILLTDEFKEAFKLFYIAQEIVIPGDEGTPSENSTSEMQHSGG